MDDDNELFGSLAIATVSTSSSRRGPDKIIEDAWKLWADLTKRPDGASVHREFTKTCRGLLRTHSLPGNLEEIVAGAARTDPRGRDPQDMRRLVAALTSDKQRLIALSALREGRDVIVFPRPKVELQCTLRELEKSLGSRKHEWIDVDYEAAGLLMERFDADQVDEIAERACRALGFDVIFPSEALRYTRENPNERITANDKRNTYHSGRAESEALSSVLFSADVAARRMQRSGARANVISAFHAQAPRGYWDAVLDEMEDTNCTAEEAYEELLREWKWHPADRS